MAPFRVVNYGSGEVRVSLFFLVVACVLVLEVKSWKKYTFYEKMMVGFDFRVSFERKLWIIFRFFCDSY